MTDEEFAAAIKPGDTAPDVAARLGITANYVRVRCRSLGIRLARPQPEHASKVDWGPIKLEKYTVAEVVAMTGVSRARVYQKCRELGVQCRPATG